MAPAKSDWLLGIAKFIIGFIRVMLVIALVALGIALGAIVVGYPKVVAEIARVDAPAISYWAIIAMLGLGATLIVLWERFLKLLRQIVGTVDSGDPFDPDNARRLQQMGWISLAVMAVAVPAGGLATWLSNVFEDADVHVSVDSGGGGLVLTLTLFILARVFRHGAQMREELEGTV